MKNRSGKRSITALAAAVLLAVFAVGLLSVLLTGASAYKRLTERDAAAYDSRTCVQYLATKVRQAPAPDFVVLTDFGDGDCILIKEYVNGEEYHTQIYCHNGWLMELFTVANSGLAPEDGEKILPLHSLTIERRGTLLFLNATDLDGNEREFLLTVRGGKGADE